jgi:hypothetical protein
MHVVQSAHLAFEMRAAMMCTKPQEILQRFVDWFSYIGDISEICLQSLIKAKNKLYGGELQ